LGNCQDSSFADLPPARRAVILQRLCDATLEARPEVREEITQKTEPEDLRVEPIGVDSAGNRYYYFPMFYRDCRAPRLPHPLRPCHALFPAVPALPSCAVRWAGDGCLDAVSVSAGTPIRVDGRGVLCPSGVYRSPPIHRLHTQVCEHEGALGGGLG
jgi:hypothetical protein